MNNKPALVMNDVNINVNQEQVMQVIVSEIEEKLITKRDELTGELLKLGSDQTKAEKTYFASLTALAETTYKKETEELCKALKKFTPASAKVMKTSYEASTNFSDDLHTKIESISITASVRIGKGTDDYGNNKESFVTKTEEVKPTKEIVKALADTISLKEAVAAKSDELISAKQKLKDIPRYERKTKAALAESSLSASKDGAALIADLKKRVINSDNFLKALPSA
jgi:hypothetical protein